MRSVLHGSSVLGAGAASPLRRAVQQASRETAAIDRATAAAIAGLAQTPGTRAALAQLARNERALLAPHSSQPLGLASSLFAYAEAAGGCRQARRAIGG